MRDASRRGVRQPSDAAIACDRAIVRRPSCLDRIVCARARCSSPLQPFARRMATNTLVINVDIAETRVALIEKGKITELFLEREQTAARSATSISARSRACCPACRRRSSTSASTARRSCTSRTSSPEEDMDELLEREEDDDAERRRRRGRRRRAAEERQARKRKRARSAARRRSATCSRRARRSMVQVTRARSAPRARASRATSRCPAATSCTCRRSITSASPSASATSKERERLREAIEAMKPPQGGLIVRTVAEGLTKKQLKADVGYLVSIWERDREEARERASAPDAALRRARHRAARRRAICFTDDVDKIVIDDREQYERLRALRRDVHARARQGRRALRRATSRSSTSTASRTRSRARSRARCRCPRGGYLIIDQAEALTAIDVNTGRFVGKGRKDLEETILKTNLEAVKEIAYQLRFRNIGGLIILDLIDMERAGQPREGATRALEQRAAEGQGEDDASTASASSG